MILEDYCESKLESYYLRDDTVICEVDKLYVLFFFFFFKQKTAYEIYQCDWSSDVCSSDLTSGRPAERR